MQIGAAYQYEPTSNTLQSWLHTASNIVRVSIAAKLPQLVSPPAAMMLFKPSREARAAGCPTLYRDAWRKHTATTRNLTLSLAALALGCGVLVLKQI